jgi:UDP-2,3-diacylglucosamine hydrolase
VTARALFISDLHLAPERPDTNARFHHFLRDEARGASALYILGDLFEYWLGDDELDEGAGDPLAAEVAGALRALSNEGTVVAVMHGNRDFLLASRFCSAAGAMLISDPIVMQVSGAPVLLMHGDTLCTDDVDYMNWRAIARSEKWQKEFLAQPLPERRRTIRGLREKSKEVIAAKPAEIMDVNADAVRDAFRRHQVRRMIHGHTHRAAKHDLEVDGRRCERWVLPDWYGRGGYLTLDDSGARLVSF